MVIQVIRPYIGFVSVIRDITERKQAEELTRTLANSSPIGVFIIQNGKFVYANPQFQKDSGYSEEELLNMESVEFVIPEDRDAVRESAVNMLKGNRTTAYEYRVTTKSGDIRWALETVASIQYRGRRAVLRNFVNITERKRAEEKERWLQRELSLSSRLASVGKLAAGVAHEINNPLTGILGFSERLIRKASDDESKRDLQRINDEARRASRVMQNLLVFARRRELKKERQNINDIVQKTMELKAYELKTSNIEVVTDLAPRLPKVVADFEQIEEVFLNIILNAEQAVTGIINVGNLNIETARRKDYVRISFVDDGPGIPADNLDKLFDPFFTTRAERAALVWDSAFVTVLWKSTAAGYMRKVKSGKGLPLLLSCRWLSQRLDKVWAKLIQTFYSSFKPSSPTNPTSCWCSSGQ